MSECESCGVDWTDHLGITGTCKRVQEQAAKIEDITESRNEWKRLAADMIKEITRLEDKIEALESSIMFCSGSCRKIS